MPVGTQVADPAHDVLGADIAGPRGLELRLLGRHRGDGGSGKTLADYNFTITISDGEGHTQIYDLHAPLGDQHAVAAARRQSGDRGFADEDDGRRHHATLSQNSVNIGFDFLRTRSAPTSRASTSTSS